MICTRKHLTPEAKNIQYLIGPTKCFSDQEMKIYSQAGFCKVREFDKVDKKTTKAQLDSKHKNRQDCGDSGKEASKEKENAELPEGCIFRPKATFPKPWFRQNYKQWKAAMDINWRLRQIKKHKIIYIQPLNQFPDFIIEFLHDNCNGFFEFLRSFCEIFFLGFQVRLLPTLNMEESGWNITSRIHGKTKQKQYLVTDIKKYLRKHLPKDGYCIVGISWTDLYPSEDMNFVLGEASAAESSGVLCFGRFEPKRFKEGQPPPPTIDKIDDCIVWRMIKVITHEICHILGMAHCDFFDCSMNESTAMVQAMQQPLFLCPVCLRKLHKTTKFNMEQRYLQLLHFLQTLEQSYTNVRISESIQWLKCALTKLSSDEVVLHSTHI